MDFLSTDIGEASEGFKICRKYYFALPEILLSKDVPSLKPSTTRAGGHSHPVAHWPSSKILKLSAFIDQAVLNVSFRM
jgi:hypothetical protein